MPSMPPQSDRDEVSVELSSPTELFNLIRRKKWTDVIYRVHTHPAEASIWIIDKCDDGAVNMRFLPLHQACENFASEEALKALIKAYPRALEQKNESGGLPLHLACKERAKRTTINLMLRLYPDGARTKDNEGRLPIHLASRQWNEVGILMDLLQFYSAAATMTDRHGLLPIHWACAQNASCKMIKYLLQSNPQGAAVKDRWGRTPLDLVSLSSNPEKNDIMPLLDPKSVATLKVNVNDSMPKDKCNEIIRSPRYGSANRNNFLRKENAYETSVNNSVPKDKCNEIIRSPRNGSANRKKSLHKENGNETSNCTDATKLETSKSSQEPSHRAPKSESSTNVDFFNFSAFENEMRAEFDFATTGGKEYFVPNTAETQDELSLEERLKQVSEDSQATAHTLHEFSDKLSNDNADLRTLIEKKHSQSTEREEQISELKSENAELVAFLNLLMEKSKTYKSCLGEMEKQRQSVLHVGNKWEDMLRLCDDIIPFE